MPPPTAARRGIQSVTIGLRVLQALSGTGGPAALSAVAQAAGLSASQTHRYLSSLIASEMARQDGVTGLYELGPGAIRLGLAALARVDLFTRADEAFKDYAGRTGRTCLVAIWGDAGATVVRWFPGMPPVVTSLAIGSVLPLLGSATGHVCLAFGDQPVIDTAVLRAQRLGHAPEGLDIPALRAQVRAAGEARVAGTLIPGLRATAVPVLDLQGRLALVATALTTSATGPASDDVAAAELHTTCRAIMNDIGGRRTSIAPA